jgi:hypothetical protein
MITNILMFIGGGSAGTAGAIKITTFLVLGFAIWNEIRGRDQVTIAHRSISSSAQRQALSVALLGVAAVVSGTLLLLMFTDYSLEKVLFESISAFATVGVSTGITYDLPANAQWLLYGSHVHGPHRHYHRGLIPRPVLPPTALPTPGRTTHHRLAQCPRRRQTHPKVLAEVQTQEGLYVLAPTGGVRR